MTDLNTIKYLSQDELRRLLKVIVSKRDLAIFLVAYYHGLRASEVGMLKTQDIDLNRGRLRINRLKRSLGGEYVMHPDEIKAVKAWLHLRAINNGYLFLSNQGLPISRRMLDYLIKKYGKKADIPVDKRHFHVLKHSIATHMIGGRADIRFVQYWLGHKDIRNTVIYAQLSDPAKDEQASELFANSAIVKL